jgi:hypothetical protein
VLRGLTCGIDTIASTAFAPHTADITIGKEFGMPPMHRYLLPVAQTGWRFNGQSEIDFAWEGPRAPPRAGLERFPADAR